MRRLKLSVIPLVVCCFSVPAQSQDQLEEIVVTAAKRQQTLQEVPIAVSVTTSETIEKAQIKDILDLQSVVPSLRAEQRQATRAANFLIRGFGGGVNNVGIESSVGIFVDGVYRSRASSAIGDLPRLERVEVLSGPQSTLFGKNASAGVISVVTPKPSGEPGGFVEFGAGNYGALSLKALYEGSLSENTAFDVSATINKRDGYLDNVFTGEELNDRNRYALRAQLVTNPNDRTEVRVLADYSNIDEFCCAVANITQGGGEAAVRAIGGQVLTGNPDDRQTALNTNPINEIDDFGGSVHLTYEFENFNFTSISAYRKNDNLDVIDTDQTSLSSIAVGANDIQIDTLTQEFRLTSTGGGNVDWVVGGFYFNETVDYDATITFGPSARPLFGAFLGAFGGEGLFQGIEGAFGLPIGSTVFGNGRGVVETFNLDNESVSLFGQADWHISDELTATLGLNYTRDEKELSVRQLNSDVFSAQPLDAIGLGALAGLQFLPPFQEFPNVVEDGKTDNDDLTYTLRLAYQIGESINVYGSYATGFKASSFNLDRGSRPFDEDIPALLAAGIAVPNLVGGTRFALPEQAEVFEIGLKSTFDRGSFNIAIFDQSIENFQESLFTTGARFVLSNAGEQSTTGAEFDLNYFVTDSFNLRLAGTFLDPVYDSFIGGNGPSGPEDLSGATPSGIHETSVSLAATYNFKLANMDAYVRGDYQYEDEIQVINNISPDVATRQVDLLNLSAGIVMAGGLSMNLWIRNVTDEVYIQSAFPDVLLAGTVNAYLNQPRTYGITLRKEF